MIDGLDSLLEASGQPGLPELRRSLQAVLGGRSTTGRLIEARDLKPRTPRIYRLCFDLDGQARSLVVKRLKPAIAQRNELLSRRWLPAVGMDRNAPALLGLAADPGGQGVWLIHEDLGDWALDPNHPEPQRVKFAVDAVAQLHIRFAEHPLLAECRLHGGDHSIYFYSSNVRDAIRALASLSSSRADLSPENIALCERLLERLHGLQDQLPTRAAALAELGGPETLLHGDLWPINIFVIPTPQGLQARLIDWDQVSVGPASYDLSTLLIRFPATHRHWILGLYREAVARAGWHLPGIEVLNFLFETAEFARYANLLVWPAIAVGRDNPPYALEQLAEVERWFIGWKPVLPQLSPAPAAQPAAV
jgi:hypothetical protein